MWMVRFRVALLVHVHTHTRAHAHAHTHTHAHASTRTHPHAQTHARVDTSYGDRSVDIASISLLALSHAFASCFLCLVPNACQTIRTNNARDSSRRCRDHHICSSVSHHFSERIVSYCQHGRSSFRQSGTSAHAYSCHFQRQELGSCAHEFDVLTEAMPIGIVVHLSHGFHQLWMSKTGRSPW